MAYVFSTMPPSLVIRLEPTTRRFSKTTRCSSSCSPHVSLLQQNNMKFRVQSCRTSKAPTTISMLGFGTNSSDNDQSDVASTKLTRRRMCYKVTAFTAILSTVTGATIPPINAAIAAGKQARTKSEDDIVVAKMLKLENILLQAEADGIIDKGERATIQKKVNEIQTDINKYGSNLQYSKDKIESRIVQIQKKLKLAENVATVDAALTAAEADGVIDSNEAASLKALVDACEDDLIDYYADIGDLKVRANIDARLKIVKQKLGLAL